MNFRLPLIRYSAVLCFAVLGALTPSLRSAAADAPDYAAETQNLPTRVAAMAGRRTVGDASLTGLLPFAYYPSARQFEVAFEITPAVRAEFAKTDPAADIPRQVTVRIVPAGGGDKPLFTGALPLNAEGCGRGRFDIPDPADGEYAVEYVLGKTVIRSPKTFKRLHFPWETEHFGLTHEVYPPFTPVQVAGAKVSVVGRTYTVNALGLFDSVVSLGHELLAGPMQLTGETVDGKPLTWKPGDVRGKVVHPDLAEFDTAAQSEIFNLQSQISVEEDGCARIVLTLHPPPSAPRPPPATANLPPLAPNPEPRTLNTLNRLTLEIPLRDAEVPLFHYIGDNSMRHNYAGVTPRGGKIVWDITSQMWCPVVYRVEPGPTDGVIWDSTQVKPWGNQQKGDYRPFVPYIWLGAEERGLAWFAENEADYAVGAAPIQEVVRQGDRVVVRVRVIGKPVTLDRPRTFVFAFMASPGKPMSADWRSRPVATGVGPVTCWGGYRCNSKYPDGGDYTIVDKIQEARRTGKADLAWFTERDKHRVWPARRINEEGETASGREAKSWLWLVSHFAERAAASGNRPAGTYFEEHATDTWLPEWEVFQDEWASVEFNRFQKQPGNWGVWAASYRDFALWHANEWLKRGVSLYFDNTNPKRCYNPQGGPAWVDDSGTLRFGTAIFGPRQYYRRIWKLMADWNRRGAPYPLDVTYHMTNTQTLPFNTWCSATLDLEQRYRLPDDLSDKIKTKKDREALASQGLPFPADYTRTVSLGRQAGSIPFVLDPLRSGLSRHVFFSENSPRRILNEWGMQRVHEIHGPLPEYTANTRRLALKYQARLEAFGYPRNAQVINYWDPKPPVTVDDRDVHWLALLRTQDTGLRTQNLGGRTQDSGLRIQAAEGGNANLNAEHPILTPDTRHLTPSAAPGGFLILQSYRPAAVSATVTWPGFRCLYDIETREVIAAGPDGRFQVALAADYGTRAFLAAADSAAFPPPDPRQAGDAVREDFEFGVGMACVGPEPTCLVVADAAGPGNHVARLSASPDGRSTSDALAVEADAVLDATAYSASCRFRTPADAKLLTGFVVMYGRTDVPEGKTTQRNQCSFTVKPATAPNAGWTVTPVTRQSGNRRETFSATVPAAAAPAADGWQTLEVRVASPAHTVLVNGTTVFAGTATGDAKGTFALAVPQGSAGIEVDDLVLKAVP